MSTKQLRAEVEDLIFKVRDAGIPVVAVDLPADDDTASLFDYADTVVDAVGDRTDLIVVAHSFGGYTAPIVCDRLPVALLVLVASIGVLALPMTAVSLAVGCSAVVGSSDSPQPARTRADAPSMAADRPVPRLMVRSDFFKVPPKKKDCPTAVNH